MLLVGGLGHAPRGGRVGVDMRLARRRLNAARMGVAFGLLRGALAKIGAGADHPSAGDDLVGAGERGDVALDLALVGHVDLSLVVEIAHRARQAGNHEAVGVEVEMVADRHAVADRHFVVGISPGVDLGALADVAPGYEIAGIDEADRGAHGARGVFDIGGGDAGHSGLSGS